MNRPTKKRPRKSAPRARNLKSEYVGVALRVSEKLEQRRRLNDGEGMFALWAIRCLLADMDPRELLFERMSRPKVGYRVAAALDIALRVKGGFTEAEAKRGTQRYWRLSKDQVREVWEGAQNEYKLIAEE